MSRAATAQSRRTLALNLSFGVASIVLTLILGAVVLIVLGASPLEAYTQVVRGAVGTPDRIAYVLTAWTPVLLCSAGLLLTFAAGLWNIGIEGQIILGAIFATGVLRALQDSAPPWLALLLAALAGILGGGLWGLLAGALRVYGNVNEIFGGLGLNFIAGSLTVYFVLGPWARPGIASTSGTLPFSDALWLPTFNVGAVAVPSEIIISLVAIVLVFFALRGTYFGLRLKAIGKSFRSAFMLGVPNTREMLIAFTLCGALAGLAGFALVTGAYSRHQLFPLISGGYGFLAILVVLLSGFNALWSIPISFFFAAIAMGSLQLPLQMQLDSSMGGVLEGLLVFIILLMQGIQSRLTKRGEQ
jgi:general nucleoside transport system permease protein